MAEGARTGQQAGEMNIEGYCSWSLLLIFPILHFRLGGAAGLDSLLAALICRHHIAGGGELPPVIFPCPRGLGSSCEGCFKTESLNPYGVGGLRLDSTQKQR